MHADDPRSFLNLNTLSGRIFDGSWRGPLPETTPVSEPATGEPLAAAGMATPADMARACREAAAAQALWAEVPARERAQVFLRASSLLTQHMQELALYIARETGGTLPKGQHEVREAAMQCQLAAAMPLSSQGHVLPSQGRLSLARRAPLGVVGVISPFNFPLILSMRSVAPALAVGNAVVLKPDPRTPVSGGLLLARVFEEAGLPRGLLQVLPGAASTGEALITDPHVAMIAFTGSPGVGARIGELAGRHMKKVSLELGGANSLIILDDADLDVAASNAAWGAFSHQGQICMASNRILVQSSVARGLIERLVKKAKTSLPVGNGASGNVALGPIIDDKQLLRVHEIVRQSVAEGAKLEAGGSYERLFYQPTVLSGVTPSMRVFRDEIFGPVASIIAFDTDEQAVALANDSRGGLAAGVISGSVSRAMAIGRRLRAGMVHINDQTVNDDVVNPFGGPGIAGNGSSMGGPADWEEYTQWQWLTVKDAATPYPF